MNFSYRVKVLGYTMDQLLAMGLAVNGHECAPGEYWIIAVGSSQLEHLIKCHSLSVISDIECIR